MDVQELQGVRILFIAELRGKLTAINTLASTHKADIVVHASTFGFYDGESSHRMNKRTMRKNITTYCPWIEAEHLPANDDEMRAVMADKMSELPLFLNGTCQFNVPVYTVWGAVEDLEVLEKFRSGEYKVPNLFILDEKSSFVYGGLRLCGLGGAFRPTSLFNKGQAKLTIPGSSLSLWVGAWQLGELANTLKGTSEPRLFISHSSIARNPLLEWFSMAIRATYTFSANLHLINTGVINRYGMEGPVTSGYEALLAQVKQDWDPVWAAASPVLEKSEDETLKSFCNGANTIFETTRKKASLLHQYRSIWHYCLTDLTAGLVVADAQEGLLATTTVSSGREVSRPSRQAPKPMHGINIKTSLSQDEAVERLHSDDQPLVSKVVAQNKGYIIYFDSQAEAQKAYDSMDKTDLASCYVTSTVRKPQGTRGGRPGRGRGKQNRH